MKNKENLVPWNSEERSAQAARYARRGATVAQIAHLAEVASCLNDGNTRFFFDKTKPDTVILDFLVGTDVHAAMKTAWQVNLVTAYNIEFNFNGVDFTMCGDGS